MAQRELLTEHAIQSHTLAVMEGLNLEAGLPRGYDQTRSNNCHILTRAVMERVAAIDNIQLRRELHVDVEENWHYLLANEPIDAPPTDEDLMLDLNPWQWRRFGTGPLYLPRHELIERLADEGAPTHFVDLRDMKTMKKEHDTRINPYEKAA